MHKSQVHIESESIARILLIARATEYILSVVLYAFNYCENLSTVFYLMALSFFLVHFFPLTLYTAISFQLLLFFSVFLSTSIQWIVFWSSPIILVALQNRTLHSVQRNTRHRLAPSVPDVRVCFIFSSLFSFIRMKLYLQCSYTQKPNE